MATIERQQEILEKLKQFDTPSITNVVATYPQDKDLCLGLYHPWDGAWYTDQSLKCMYPALGRMAGYVVTCVYGMPDPNYERLGFPDILRAIGKSPKPVILAIKQDLPDRIKNINGLSGGNMTTAFKSAGVIGVISDGPSRDIDEIRPMGIQYMLTGTTAGHGAFSLTAVNVPVNICGMDVCTGDIVHMDENGAVKFPAEYLEDVLDKATRLAKVEENRMKDLASTNDIEKLIRIWNGFE